MSAPDDPRAGAGPVTPPQEPRVRGSLRTRLLIAASIVIALVIGIQSYLEIRWFEARVEQDLKEEGELTAQAVSDDVELRGGLPLGSEIERSLHEFLKTVPTNRVISIVTLGPDGQPQVQASTSSQEQAEPLAVAAAAIRGDAPAWRQWSGSLMSYALPVMRGESRREAAVVVTVSRISVDQLRRRGRLVTLWLAPIGSILLTVLIDQLAREFIYRPLAAIRATMRRTGAGEVGLRVPVVRPDELGMVADGLNQMLDRVERFNAALQERVEEATVELRASHGERLETYRRNLVLREALARSEQLAAVGQTAASVAHQVGTPLNLVSGYVQMLLAAPDLEPKVARRLETVQEQIGKVSDAVRGLLDRARPAAPAAPIDIVALVERLRDLAAPRLEAAGIRVHLDVAAPLPPVIGGEIDLELALLNLVANAIDAMPGGGQLDLAAAADGAAVRLAVRDTGTGIPDDLLPRIFEPWFTTKPVGRGTGLGLSITREVITRLGGTIEARNRAEGGAEFQIVLPTGG